MEVRKKKTKDLSDTERYIRDRASVMSMLKFILTVVILVAIGYIGKNVVVILVPFLIGFLISKTSIAIAKGIAKPFEKKESNLKAGKKKPLVNRIALVVYVILNILAFAIVILTCIGLAYQANNFLVSAAEIARTFKPDEAINTQLLERFSVENGGFLTPDMLASLEVNISNMVQTIVENVPKLISSALSTAWRLVGNIPYAVFFVISIILSGFYFIHDGPAVMRFFVKNTPNRSFRSRISKLLNELFNMVFRVLGGYFVLFVITALESLAVFFFAGLREYAIILALVTAVIDFLPVLGVSVTMIPSLIYLISHEQYASAAVVLVGYVLMTIIRRFIEPPILGKSMHMHPLITLISMAAGVYLWGAAGFLLGPILAIIIIQVIKVFDLDKKFGRYFSGVWDRFMGEKEDTEQTETTEEVTEA